MYSYSIHYPSFDIGTNNTDGILPGYITFWDQNQLLNNFELAQVFRAMIDCLELIVHYLNKLIVLIWTLIIFI